MRKDKNPELAVHFEKLKAILPEIYHPKSEVQESNGDKLFSLLRSSLGVIEAVYLQHPESFTSAKIDAYATIIMELKQIGVSYHGNQEILNRAANEIIIQSKKPMERAGKRISDQGKQKRVG